MKQINTRNRKYQNLAIYFCNNETIDATYDYFKTQRVHFAIVQLQNNKISFLNAFCSLMPAFGIFITKHIKKPIEINNEADLDEKTTHALIVRFCSSLNNNVIIAAELSMNHLIPKSYVYRFSYHTKEYEFRKFPVYSSPFINPKGNTILIIENASGYGDALITMPLLQKVANNFIKLGLHVEIMHYYPRSYELSNVFLNRCKNKMCDYIDNRKSLSQLYNDEIQQQYRQIYNFDNYIVKSAATKLSEISNLLDYTEYDKVLDDLYINIKATPIESMSLIETYKKKYRYLIGVQFKTEHDDVCFCTRSWSNKHINKFLLLCNKNDIGVINLAPCKDIDWQNNLDFSYLSIPQLFGIMLNLSLFVGIDSCCGHIASTLKIPNITIWGKPLKDKSQRPLCMNYSIVSNDGNIDSLSAESVFQRVLEMLDGKILVSNEIRIINAVDDYYTEWI